MLDLFKAELQRYRHWALAAAVLHLLVLSFLTRVVDLAQQPQLVYQLIAACYAALGLLLGLQQMAGYRRPSNWLHLLHRPLPPPAIAAALCLACLLLLATVIVLPLLLVAGWQEWMTARVLDSRHLLMLLAAWLIAGCGYLAGAYAALAPTRHSSSALVLLLWLALSQASGGAAIALQLLALLWLLGMLWVAFQPDREAMGNNALSWTLITAPLLMTGWIALLVLGLGLEILWIMQGGHPNYLPAAPAGGIREAEYAEGRDLLLAGLADSRAAAAPLWREQAAISEIFVLGSNLRALPRWQELGNVAPMEFDDGERRIRWVFSHDSGRFHGYRLGDGQAIGQLGEAGDAAFPQPPLPAADGLLFSRHAVYQYDHDSQRVLLRVQLADNETLTGAQRVGERLAVLSQSALYLFDARGLSDDETPLPLRYRLALPGPSGALTRIDLMELIDGYLVSTLYTRGSHNGDSGAEQHVLQIDDSGVQQRVAQRTLGMDYPLWFRYQNWLGSPLLDGLRRRALTLWADDTPAQDLQPPPIPGAAWALAAGGSLLAALLAAWRMAGVPLPRRQRWLWLLLSLLAGLPALIAIHLLLAPSQHARVGWMRRAQTA